MHSDFYRRTFLIVTAVVLGYAAYRIVSPLLGILGLGNRAGIFSLPTS